MPPLVQWIFPIHVTTSCGGCRSCNLASIAIACFFHSKNNDIIVVKPIFDYSESIMGMVARISKCDRKKMKIEFLNLVCYGFEFFIGCVGPQDTISASYGYEKYLMCFSRSSNNKKHYRNKKYYQEKWQDSITALKLYQSVHGHCKVYPKDKKNRQLYKFLGYNQQKKLKGKLKKDDPRHIELNSIDPKILGDVKSHQEKWQDSITALKLYQSLHGHCKVSPKDKINKKLYYFLQKCRQLKYDGKLKKDDPHHIELDSIDPKILGEGKSHQEQWRDSITTLKLYQSVHGHCKVSPKDKKNKKLYYFLQKCRSSRFGGKLKKDDPRCIELNSICDSILGTKKL